MIVDQDRQTTTRQAWSNEIEAWHVPDDKERQAAFEVQIGELRLACGVSLMGRGFIAEEMPMGLGSPSDAVNLGFVGWEFRRLPRSPRAFVFRSLFLTVLAAAFALTYHSVLEGESRVEIRTAARFASSLLTAYLLLGTLAIIVLIPALVQSSFASAKEKGSLELLLASPMSSVTIVLGKMLPCWFEVLLFVLGGLPVVAVAGLFGGVSYSLLAMIAGYFVTLGGAAAAFAAWIAAGFRKDSAMASWTFVLITSLFFALLFVPAISPRRPNPFLLILAFHPLGFAIMVPLHLDGMISSSLLLFTIICSACHALWIILFFLQASGRLRLRFGHSLVTPRRDPIDEMFPAKAPLEDSHPLIWKDSKPVTDNHFGVWILILPLAIGIWYLCLCAELVTHGDTKLLYDYPFRFGSLIIGTALIVISAYIAMAHRAALSIAKEKDQQTWLILLTTPMTAREILWSKMVITWQPLAFGLMIIGPAWLLGILTGAVGIFSLLATIGIIISHALLLSAWGLWQSLRQPSRRQAIIHTFAWAGVTMGGIQLLLYCLHPYSPFTDILFGTVPILAVGLPLFTSFDNSIHWAVCSAVASALVAAIVGLTLTYQTYRQFPVLTERVE